MERVTMYIATMLVAVLAAGALAGCGQQASSGSASASGASSAASEQAASEQAASAASGQAVDEVVADLKNTAANAPKFESVTVKETTEWSYTDDETGKPETVQATGVYKFDMSGDQLKQSVLAEFGGEKLQYFTDDKNAVFVYGGTAYSGTDEQFGVQDYVGFDTYMKHVVGDLGELVGSATSAEKTESNGSASYVLTLDPAKFAASDELLTTLSELGYPVKEALLTVSFDENGNVGSMDLAVSFEDSKIVESLAFSDFDSTVVEPAPKATMTYEEMEKALQQEIAGLAKELDAFMASEGGASSASAAKAS